MSLRDHYADYLTQFSESAETQIAHQVSRDGYGTLRGFEIGEDEQGVW
ncbi:hypothetical protein SSBG_04936, partial [Streptomyces sp. SPB074]